MSKLVVMNFSGNVGKSTVARHLLSPRVNNATLIVVESINSDGSQDEAVRGRQFGELIEAVAVLDDVVVDVGASNVEDFIGQMKQYRGSHEDFDFFVIPTVPKTKQLRDTISTIESLREVGVPAKKIRVVFNMVEIGENPERLFASLFDYHLTEKSFTLKPDAVIHVSDIFSKIGNANIIDILNDKTDFKALSGAAIETEEKVKYTRLLSNQRLAAGVTEELDAVFKTLFK